MSPKAATTTRAVPDTAHTTSHSGHPIQRMCQGSCGEPIPAKRLLAMPNARLCVPCLVAAGDVLPIKRFDEVTGDGEVSQTYFTQDRRIERQINHLNKSFVAGAEMFNTVTDEAHLEREEEEIIDGGRSLASAFEDDMEAPVGSGFHLNLLTLQRRSYPGLDEEEFAKAA